MPLLRIGLRSRWQRFIAAVVAENGRLRHNALVQEQRAALAVEALADLEAKIAAVDAAYAADDDEAAWVAATLQILEESRAARELRSTAAAEMLLP